MYLFCSREGIDVQTEAMNHLVGSLLSCLYGDWIFCFGLHHLNLLLIGSVLGFFHGMLELYNCSIGF